MVSIHISCFFPKVFFLPQVFFLASVDNYLFFCHDMFVHRAFYMVQCTCSGHPSLSGIIYMFMCGDFCPKLWTAQLNRCDMFYTWDVLVQGSGNPSLTGKTYLYMSIYV